MSSSPSTPSASLKPSSDSITTMSITSLTPAGPTSFPPPSSQTAASQSNNNPNGDGGIATSASLYLYTFLATLVLLLSVSAAIVIRSFVLRRRHRLMVEEAIRNGTWVPPAPPTRPPKVDLSKRPVLWEAYIDKNGDLVGHAVNEGAGGGTITDVWKTENTKDWDMIKPVAATYVAANETSISPPLPGSPPSSTGLAAIPSVGSLRATAALQPTGQNSGSPDLEAGNGATPTATPTSTGRSRMPRPRALLSRALHMLNPTPDPTSPLPAPTNQNSGSNANLASGTSPEGMTELKSPQVMRVAVLIAMPKPPGSDSHSHSHSHSSSVTSHPLQPSTSSSPHHPPHLDDDDEQLPHLEMGVADVLVVPPDSAETPAPSGKKKAAQRGSLGSMATESSDM